MKNFCRGLIGLVCCAFMHSCSSGIDFPTGTSKGYNSARLIAVSSSSQATEEEKVVYGMIQNSIQEAFLSRGMSYGQPDAELIVAYLVVYQETGMTTFFGDYYGNGNDAEEISSAAHMKGVVKGDDREAYQRAGLVVDVINAKTDELIYRNYATGDVVRGVSQAQRAQRIKVAVNEALAAFFK